MDPVLQEIYERFLSAMGERIQNWKDSISNGGAKTYEEYKLKVGRIDGAESALAEFKEIVSQRISEDEFE